MTHVVLSLGSNIDREKNIQFAIRTLREHYGRIDVSPVYETSAVGFEGPPFFNLVVGLNTDKTLEQVVADLKQIEGEAGRVKGAKKFDSRVLDIDVLLFGEANLRGSGVNVPRDEIEKYAYVLKPLADVYADLIHPDLGRSFGDMWRSFEMKDQTVFIAELPVAEAVDGNE